MGVGITMVVSKRQQLITFFIWLLIVPLGFFVAHSFFPSRELDWANILLLFAIMFLTMLLPLQFQTVTISLERWVTLTIFFQYGVFTELVFIQVAMFIILFTEKSSLPLTHKFFVNSTIFTILSIVSGFVFHYAGGTIGSLNFSDVFLFGLLYAASYSLLNNILLKVYFLFNARIYSLRSKGALWDYISTLIMVPFSISLYFLHEHLDNKSLLLIGIPFIIVLVVLRMYNTSNTLNDQLSHAGEIGHELADRLLFDEVIETFLEKLKDVVPFGDAYVVDLRGGKKLIPLMGSESGVITKDVKGISFLAEKEPDDGLDKHFSQIYFNEKEVRSLKNIDFTHQVGTVMTAPIVRNQKTEGFLILTSVRKNSFRAVDMQIIDILTGYFAISLEKAKYFENTIEKSERCGLTKLNNFRYLDRKLDEETMRYHLGSLNELSVIILDIDHFKGINDTYGHESGNDILIQLAQLLLKFKKPNDTLARYGGEEFVLVLPNTSKVEAADLAETIRQEVENTPFKVIPDLSESRITIDVKITISLGVATVPDDAETAKDLLRNADRALYIGGKQAGRNRVGLYEDEAVTSVF